ncbi:D-aminoacyl-tRNA deacylase [Methanocalculus alkaliphilus]|uniref:D-aminoacyl-tRNA deacylase n=1 Tax=Methanocalculus alkaliphilus TaxID=768730 RepID=UPI00209EBBB3|nr:D-aminoacyl-tRNA deacylase [Methanocalculus alkaliphilus]MCP1714907.1 D-aminoacyl-tRNA deacylase [Methanocalculus alkaliphilus]
MVTALLYSRIDPAGVLIHAAIHDLIDEEGEAAWPLLSDGIIIHEIEGRLIYERGLDQKVDADRIIFLSRHTSTRPEPVLTVHVTGNFGEAAYGGEPDELAAADPGMMQAVLKNLLQFAPPGYRAGYEVTHHGPSDLTTPSLFVEVGSTEVEWHDTRAARAVAKSVLSAVPGADAIPMIGFGGTHYAVRQSTIATETRGAFGHIAHSREAGSLTIDTVRRMAERSGAVAGYIDRKSVSTSDAHHITALLREADLRILSEGTLRAMGDIPWNIWCSASDLAEKAAPGSKMSNHGIDQHEELTIISLPDTLLSEALRYHPEEFISSLNTITPCIRLEKGGAPALPDFIGYRESGSQLASDLITLCVQQITKHHNSVMEGDRLIIRRDRFNPEYARKLGVPPGPLFGRLANGQTVTVGDRVIRPAMVCSCEVQEIQIPGLESYT